MTMDKKTLLNTAYLHFQAGQWDQAIEQYKKLLELDPADALALNMLGDAHARQGRIIDALQFYRQAAQVFVRNGSGEKAEMVKRKMAKLDPNSVEETVSAEKVAVQGEGEAGLTDAIERLKAQIASDPKNLEHYQKAGELMTRAGRNSEAAEYYLTVANALYNNRLFSKAQPLYQRIIEVDPGNFQAHVALGEIYSKEGSDSEAKKEFLFVAENLIRQGNLERGQLFAQKAIQLKSIEAHYYLGLVFYLKGQLQEARSEFEVLLKFKVSHQGALTHLAQIFIAGGQLDEASALFERLLKADSKNADAMEKQAELALKQGKTDAALEAYGRAMDAFAGDEQWERVAACAARAAELNPQNPEYYLKLADAAYNAGLEEQAAEACSSLAKLYDALGKADQAGQMRVKARELRGEAEPGPAAGVKSPPARPAAQETGKSFSPADEIKMMMNMAAGFIQQGSLDEAIEIYLKILKTDPNNEEVKTALTRAYAMFAGVNPEAAVAKKNAAKNAKPDAADEQQVQREAQLRAQREAQVRAQQRNAAPAAPESPQAKTPSKEPELLQAVGSLHEDEIAGDHQDEFMTVTVAEIYTKQGLLNEALKIYQKILEIEPGNLEAQVKKQDLETTLAEQERLRLQSEETAKKKAKAEKAPEANSGKTKETGATTAASKPAAVEEKAPTGPEDAVIEAPDKGGSKRNNKDDGPEPPSSKGRRGRVSYV